MRVALDTETNFTDSGHKLPFSSAGFPELLPLVIAMEACHD